MALIDHLYFQDGADMEIIAIQLVSQGIRLYHGKCLNFFPILQLLHQTLGMDGGAMTLEDIC